MTSDLYWGRPNLHTDLFASGRPLNRPIPPTPLCPVHQHAHGSRRSGDKTFDDARRDPADALGLAAVVAEGELVEVGLQVLVAHRASLS